VGRPSDRAGGVPSYSASHPQASNVCMSPLSNAEHTMTVQRRCCLCARAWGTGVGPHFPARPARPCVVGVCPMRGTHCHFSRFMGHRHSRYRWRSRRNDCGSRIGRVLQPVSLVAYSLKAVIVRISGGLLDFAIGIESAYDPTSRQSDTYTV